MEAKIYLCEPLCRAARSGNNAQKNTCIRPVAIFSRPDVTRALSCIIFRPNLNPVQRRPVGRPLRVNPYALEAVSQ